MILERGLANVPKLNQRRSDDPIVRRGGQRSEIAEFYTLGVRVLAFADKNSISITSAARAFVKQGLGFDRAEKAAAFARLYRRSPPHWLFKLRTAAGKPLSVNHVRRILSIKDVEKQRELLTRAADRGWGADRLAHEIAPRGKIAGHRPPLAGRAGPKAKRPIDLTDTLVKVSRWAEEWLTRYDSVWAVDAAWPPILGLGEKDPADLAEMVGEVIGSLKRIQENSEALTERLIVLRRRLRNEKTRKGSGKASAK